MVTSRRRLALPQECGLDLAPLPVDEALALFQERTIGATPAVERQVLLSLVESLDRLPLALELAAARTQILSPHQLLERLERRLEVLRNVRLHPDERHASLENAIAFSWDLLSQAEQDCLVQAAVFCDGFDAEAAEQLIRLEEADTVPVLSA